MIKRVTIFSLRPGVDPDEFWNYHTRVHAEEWKRLAGSALKKYSINRVTKVVRGEPVFWGMVEQWWDSEEARAECGKRAYATPSASGLSVQDEFNSRVMNSFQFQVEEKEISL